MYMYMYKHDRDTMGYHYIIGHDMGRDQNLLTYYPQGLQTGSFLSASHHQPQY